MKITKAKPEFRPITIVIETEDEWDKLKAIVCAVSENKINHTPAVIRAAVEFDNVFLAIDNDE